VFNKLLAQIWHKLHPLKTFDIAYFTTPLLKLVDEISSKLAGDKMVPDSNKMKSYNS